MSNKVESKTMKPTAKPALAPKLRFPEFRGAGDWEKKELREVATIISKKAGSNKFTLMSITAGVGLVSQLEKFGREIAGAQYKNYFVICKNDFAYNKSATKEYPEGFIGMYSGDGPGAVPNSIFTCFRVDGHLVSPGYLNYLFLGNLHGRWLKKFITVGARAHGSLNIDNNDLLALLVPFPQGATSLQEQQKIADCLSSIDELVTLAAQKLDTLKAHKKGLMQQLFPAEGETLPKLRFPEFQDAGEWEGKLLGSFIEEFREKSTVQDEFEVLTSARGGLVRQREYYDNDRITERDNIGFNIIPPNYLTYRSRSDDRRFYFNENILGITGIISTYYPVFRVVDGCNKFFIELLSRYSVNVGKHSVGTSQTVLSLNELRRIKLPIPKAPEQQKIADCLSSLDDLITAQTQKLATLKTHKKGLMQQLFPVLDEVQG
jgi:type I restriction enzyme S subunit